MKNCHVCNFECPDEAELCPICGADITAKNEDEQAASEETQRVEPVLLTTFEDLVSSEIFKDVLTDNKIPYSDSEDDVMKVTFGGGFASEEIYVDKIDYDKARELLEEFLASEAEFENGFEDGFCEEQ